jgi:hypothetical protein
MKKAERGIGNRNGQEWHPHYSKACAHVQRIRLRVRIGLNRHALNTDPKLMTEIETTLKGNIQGAKDAMKKYEPLIISDDKDKSGIRRCLRSTRRK